MHPKITVITATRNRSQTLNRVFKSLSNQTYKNFEWIVCDDASNDKTIELLKKYKKIAKFKNKFFYFEKRAGKPKIDNFCIKKAKGKFLVFADSDDAFKKNSFSDFIKEWKKIPKSKINKVFAIISRVTTPSGKHLEKKLNFENKIISLLDLWNKYNKKKEKWLFIKKSILLKYKFPEIDFYIPEGIVWERISLKYKVWILDKCYRIFYSDTLNSITHSKKIKYSIGQLRSLEIEVMRNNRKKFSLKKIKKLINYERFLLINNIFFNYGIKEIKYMNLLYRLPFKLLGCLLFVKDLVFLNIDNERFEKNLSKPLELK